MWANSMLSLASLKVKRYRIALVLAGLMLLYCGTFMCLIRHFTVSYGSEEESWTKPQVILYFSANRLINETLYVAFFPCVQMMLLSRDDIAFAHGGELFRGVTEFSGGSGQHYDSTDRSTTGRAVAVAVWVGGVVVLMMLFCRRGQHGEDV